MSNIPTAEEMALKWEYANMNAMGTEKQGSKELSIATFMIEFAKLHVQAALKAASENVEIDGNIPEDWINKNSIINAYPIDNIK